MQKLKSINMIEIKEGFSSKINKTELTFHIILLLPTGKKNINKTLKKTWNVYSKKYYRLLNNVRCLKCKMDRKK